jgi:hypothetical protein
VRLSLVAALVILFTALGAAGCFSLGDGKGSLAGALFVRSCTSDTDYGSSVATRPYDMKPTFFVAAPIDDFARPHPMNRLSVREQPTGNRVEEADAMILMIANVRDVAVALGQAIPVGPSTNVRATLSLNQLCPSAEVALELDGTVAFSNFGSATATAVPEDFKIEFEDRLTAAFHFDVIDRRAIVLGGIGGVPPEPAVGGHIDGDFDFIVRQGRAAQSP